MCCRHLNDYINLTFDAHLTTNVSACFVSLQTAAAAAASAGLKLYLLHISFGFDVLGFIKTLSVLIR